MITFAVGELSKLLVNLVDVQHYTFIQTQVGLLHCSRN